MGPVPPGFSLERIVGRQLNQICIGPFDLQFRFDCDHGIFCTGRVIVEIDGQSTIVFHGETWGDVSPLPRIVGQDVATWKLEGSHEFSVTLTGGARLRFLSTDCSYEEFVIRPEEWVV
jgi:hypothetical protein